MATTTGGVITGRVHLAYGEPSVDPVDVQASAPVDSTAELAFAFLVWELSNRLALSPALLFGSLAIAAKYRTTASADELADAFAKAIEAGS